MNKLPTRLDTTYNDAMVRIQSQVEQHSLLAMRALGWLSNANRPLGVTELIEALAIKPGDSGLDEEGKTDPMLIVSVCAGLVTIDTESNIIRLVHFTIGEQLERTRAQLFPMIDNVITETFLTYLMFEELPLIVQEHKSSEDKRPLNKALLDRSFLAYALSNWGSHARGTLLADTRSLTVTVLKDSDRVWLTFQWIRYMFSCRLTGVHLAADFNLNEILADLLSYDVAANAWDVEGRTPLAWAAARGHLPVV